jgi:hypothetical protein
LATRTNGVAQEFLVAAASANTLSLYKAHDPSLADTEVKSIGSLQLETHTAMDERQ